LISTPGWSFDGSGPLLRQRALDLLDEAIVRLGEVATDRDTAIHDVRKRLKELRAAAELLRARLDDHGRSDRATFRDAGRRLAGTRDAKAAIEAFDHLREHYADEWRPGEFLKIRRTLARRLPNATDVQTIEALSEILHAARRRIAAWPVDGMKQDEVWPAFRRSYRRARNEMAAAVDTRRPELLHEWRKRVKIHWYHAQLASETGLARLDRYAKALHKLSDKLGEHHDLVVIESLLRTDPEAFGSPLYVLRFLDFVGRRMRELESDAASHGRDLFAERPRIWEQQARNTIERRGPKRA